MGRWENEATGDWIRFESDGSVAYAIGEAFGGSSSFTFDGEQLAFGDYTGRQDGDGDLIIEGVEGWFRRVS